MGAGPRRSRAADQALTEAMWDLWVSGVSQREIGRRYGIAHTRVSERLTRFRQAMPPEEREALVQRESALLESMRAKVAEVLEQPDPPLWSHGRPVVDADGNQVPDFGPRLKAIEAAERVHDRFVRLYGLAAPAQVAVDVSLAERASAAARQEAAWARAYLAGEAEALDVAEVREIEHGGLLAQVEALVPHRGG